ncbi:hypothetical protein [Methylotenera versatilis]|uniref:hypothetical protein n=1 Tax=Methylotenera versatilis TaxID=1055487 RepID=UPI000690ED3E|nr:hypothetical protein [Methylotenera versatilis]
MNSENGKIEGSMEILKDFQLNGTITGNATVKSGVYFRLNGVVLGNLTIENGGSSDINGVVCGNVINEGGTVSVTGVVQGAIHGGANISPNAKIG